MKETDIHTPMKPPIDESSAPEVIVVEAISLHRTVEFRTSDTPAGEDLLREDAKSSSVGATPALDRAQDRVMIAISPDGRPPKRPLRMAGWRWFIIGASAMGLAGATWALSSGMDGATLLMGSALVLVFLAAAVPTWGAGLLRGGEEREARKAALLQAHRNEASP